MNTTSYILKIDADTGEVMLVICSPAGTRVVTPQSASDADIRLLQNMLNAVENGN